MDDREPTPDSLALGSALENVMMGAGLNRTQLARRLGRDPSYVSRLITGKRGGRAQDVVAWLDRCNVTGILRLEILKLRLPCPTCGCRCDHTGSLTCCDASGGNPVM